MASNPDDVSLFVALAKHFDGDIDTSIKTRVAGSSDKSPISISPRVVVFPKTVADIKKIFLFAKEYGLSCAVRGNGTSSAGGSLTSDIQINLSRYFTRIEKVDIKKNTATIQTGATISSVIKRLSELGVACPLLSPDTHTGTIGGMVSLNKTTQGSLIHGNTRLWVESLRIILDDGEEYTLSEGVPLFGRLLELYQNISMCLQQESGTISASRNNHIDTTTGYNLWSHSLGQRQLLDLFVGSEGTLGVITSVTLRVVPTYRHTYTLSCGVQTFDEIERVFSIYKKQCADAVCFFDTNINVFANTKDKTFFSFEGQKYTSRYVISGIFTRKDENTLLQVIKATENLLTNVSSLIYKEEGDDSPQKEVAYANSVLSHYLGHAGEHVCITTLDGITINEDVWAKTVKEISSTLSASQYPHLFGVTNLPNHIAILFFADTLTRDGRQSLQKVTQEIMEIIKQAHGSCVSGNGDGILRTPYMSVSSDTHLRTVFSYLQRLCDPNQILNTGKKTHTTEQDIEEYLHRKAIN